MTELPAEADATDEDIAVRDLVLGDIFSVPGTAPADERYRLLGIGDMGNVRFLFVCDPTMDLTGYEDGSEAADDRRLVLGLGRSVRRHGHVEGLGVWTTPDRTPLPEVEIQEPS